MIPVENIVSDVRQQYNVHRPFTAWDFYRICRGEGINVIHSPEAFTFLLIMPTGDRFINLPKRKRGRERLRAMYHELGHHFCGHVGSPVLNMPAIQDIDNKRDEAEADQFAELAIR